MSRRQHLVAVMPDAESAARLARGLRQRGVAAESIATGERLVETEALRAEVAAETTDAVVAPQAAFIASKEAVRGTALFTLVGSIAALAIAAPIALIEVAGLDYWARYLIEAAFLVFMVFLIAYVLGGAWGWDPERPLAAERGVVVRIDDISPQIEQFVIAEGPLRVDRVTDDGAPAGAVHTEGTHADEHIKPKVGDTVHRVQESMRDQARRGPEGPPSPA